MFEALRTFKKHTDRAVVVAELAERLLLIPEGLGSYPASAFLIKNIYLLYRKDEKRGRVHFIKKKKKILQTFNFCTQVRSR